MDSEHPASTAAHGGGCRPPPPPLVDDVTEREQRLTALVNVLGFPSLDDLEDFVFLHGAAKVVPAAQRDTLSLDDTQTQYSETRHARRNEERKLENAQLRRDLAQARDQLEWTRAEVAKERGTNAALLKDKERLLGIVEGVQRSNFVPPSPTLASRSSGAVPSSSQAAALPVEVELSHCWDDIAALEADVGALEAALERANEARDECEVELRDLKHELVRAQDDIARGETAIVELAQIKERLAAVLPAVFGVDRLVSASPAPTTSSSAAPSPRPGSALASSGLPRAPPTPRHKPSSGALSPHPNDSTRSTSTSTSRTPKPTSQPALHEAEPSTPALAADPTTAEADTPAPPPLDPPPTASARAAQATPAPLVHPRVVAIGRPSASSSPAPLSAVGPTSTAAPSTPTGLPSSTSTPRTLSKEAAVVAKAQISLYPRLLAEYTSQRDALLAFQASLPALDARIAAFPADLTAAWRLKHSPSPILAADELERFAPAPALPDDARARHDMAHVGTLGELYGDVEGKERELSALVGLMSAWEKSAARLLKRLERARATEADAEGARTKAGTLASAAQGTKRCASAVEGEAATPSSTAQAVRKRRKVVKTATPGLSVTPAPQPSVTPAPVVQQGPLALVVAAPAPMPPPAAAALVADPVARVMTPTRPAAASSPKGSDRQTPRWNLVSPGKRGRISPQKLSGSGIKAQLWRAGGEAAAPDSAAADRSAVLVEDTQLGDVDELAAAAVEGPARKLWSDHGSTLEPEPDTLRTDASSQQQRMRSSSCSPRKPTPRRASSIMPQRHALPVIATDADDPFVARPLQPSPNARSAAAQSRAASAAASSPDSSPSRTQGKSFEMPPSAQPGSRLGGARAEPAEGAGVDVPASVGYRRELRFFGGLGTPPLLETGSPSPSPSPRKKSAAARPSPSKLGVTSTKGRHDKGKGKMRAKDKLDLVAVKREADDEDDLDEPPAPAPDTPPASSHKKRRRAASKTLKVESGAEDSADDALYPNEPFPDVGMTDKDKKLWFDALRAKRKLRWAVEAEEKRITSASKRSKLEVNPDRNRGESQLYKETERRKKERQKMLAEPCQQCVQYYERAGKPVRCTHVHQGPVGLKRHLDLRADEIEARNLQSVGRHRVQQRTEKEPPDYWQMGMPSSGHVEEINRRAKAQNDERRAYQEKEAQTGNGVYRWRTHAHDGR